MRQLHIGSIIVGAALVGLASGCGPGDAPGEIRGTRFAASQPGPWKIPAETLAAGDQQDVGYDGATSCAGDLTSGAQRLGADLQQAFPQIDTVGGYACRGIVGNEDKLSVHATGRALDLMVGTSGGSADNDAGDPIGNWLIENAEAIGVQYIIWDQWSWRASASPGSRGKSYGGSDPHIDHLHVEITEQAADEQTAYFNGGVVSPPGGETGSIPYPAPAPDPSTDAGTAPNDPWSSDSTGGHATGGCAIDPGRASGATADLALWLVVLLVWRRARDQ